ncbi:MAG: HDIG domain-containing metalloprotein [Cyanobacteria bacterium P01_D01_bin.123]
MLIEPPPPKTRFNRAVLVTWWLTQQAKLVRLRFGGWKAALKRGALFTVVVLLSTAAHGYRYYNEPQITVGSTAPQTERAPYAANVVDLEATTARDARMRREAEQVLRVDETANLDMRRELDRLWSEIHRISESAATLPFADTEQLSSDTQVHLLSQPAEDWQRLRRALRGNRSARQLLESEENQQALRELQSAIRLENSDRARDRWVAQIELARQRYRQAAAELRQLNLSTRLLAWTPDERAQVEGEMRQALRRLQAIGIAPGLPRDMRQRGIAVHLESLPPHLQVDANDWLQDILQPNLNVDRQLTQAQIDADIAALDPVTVSVEANELIVRSDQAITPRTFAILDAYGLTQRRINVTGLARLAGILAVAAVAVVVLEKRINPTLRDRDRLLLGLMICTVAPVAGTLGVQFTSLPAVGLLASSYYGTGVGLLVIGATALLLPLATSVTGLTLVPLMAGSFVACMLAARLRSREELALLGGGAALTQMFVFATLSLLMAGGIDISVMALTGAAGFLWSIVALGASPNLEPVFDIVTPIRLAELANPNRPLLRRLATEAPGTYQHTMFVAALAERAAQKLKLNTELVRTGTLYHDIGKMLQAEFFIENQMGGPNPHVGLDDPYRSAQIIKDHVADGLKMARQYRLPTAIRAFIPEHQGTIRIAYFYHQAQLRSPDRLPDDSSFRYDGPIPQSRETGVVMLADACEAALRSLSSQEGKGQSVSEDEARRTISRIFQSRWQDGQLLDSKLTRDNLETVADVFVQVWKQYNHERIRYPSLTTSAA